jgi:hypothetical protein
VLDILPLGFPRTSVPIPMKSNTYSDFIWSVIPVYSGQNRSETTLAIFS